MLSRVADNLYWMSRYLERAEHAARLLDVNLSQRLDQIPDVSQHRWQRLAAALAVPFEGTPDAFTAAERLTLDTEFPGSIVASIAGARENMRQVREQVSSEMWEQLNRLYHQLRQTTMEEVWAEPHTFYHRGVKEGIHLFQGITDATLSHGEGWQWIRLGRFIERAASTAALLDGYFQQGDEPHVYTNLSYLEWVGLLKSFTSFEAYCNVYTADVRPERIAEFLLLNSTLPRSVRFSAARIQESVEAIEGMTNSGRALRARRLSGRLLAMLDYGDITEIMEGGLHGYLRDIQEQCYQINNAIYQSYISYPVDSAFAA